MYVYIYMYIHDYTYTCINNNTKNILLPPQPPPPPPPPPLLLLLLLLLRTIIKTIIIITIIVAVAACVLSCPWLISLISGASEAEQREPRRYASDASLEWHYLSNATCLIRPHVFYAVFVVSRIPIICNIFRHV